jgi:flagella basal body P-ring formation protein FlgA
MEYLVPTREIAKGEALTREVLAVKKPGTGIPADEIDRVCGMVARRKLFPDELLAWEDLKQPGEDAESEYMPEEDAEEVSRRLEELGYL